MNEKKREEISPGIVDHYAHPDLLGLPPTNPWECVRCKEKEATLRHLDESLRDSSDYEAFALWERVRPLSVGTGVWRWSMAERQWLCTWGESCQDDWRRGSAYLSALPVRWDEWFSIHGTRAPIGRRELSVLLASACEDESLEEWARRISKSMQEEKTVHLFVDLPSAYQRPDPYHAQQIWEKKRRGESLSPAETCALTLQGLLLLLKERKGERVIHWQGDLGSEGSRQGFAYLRDRGLLRGEIRLRVGLCCGDWSWIDCYQSAGKELSVHPELVLRMEDFTDRLTERIKSLAEGYPFGGIRFGGIDTDSLTFFLGHKMFVSSLSEALTSLGLEETDPLGTVTSLLSRFFS